MCPHCVAEKLCRWLLGLHDTVTALFKHDRQIDESAFKVLGHMDDAIPKKNLTTTIRYIPLIQRATEIILQRGALRWPLPLPAFELFRIGMHGLCGDGKLSVQTKSSVSLKLKALCHYYTRHCSSCLRFRVMTPILIARM